MRLGIPVLDRLLAYIKPRTRLLYTPFVLIACIGATYAQTREDSSLAQMYHRTWTVHDGVPQGIWTMAVAPDGFLWLGTGSGLYRFDGRSFRRYSAEADGLLSDEVTGLGMAQDGGLLVGYQFGGVSIFYTGQQSYRTVHFPTGTPGLARGAVRNLVEGDGIIYAGTTHGLSILKNRQWSLVRPSPGDPDRIVFHPLLDECGNIWIDSLQGTMQVLEPHASTFKKTAIPSTYAISCVGSGKGWSTDNHDRLISIARSDTGEWRPTSVALPGEVDNLFSDHEGDLWLLRGDGGIGRVPARFSQNPGKLEPQQLDVMPGAHKGHPGYAARGLVDAEGGIWLIAGARLDYYRRTVFRPISFPEQNNGVALAAAFKKVFVGPFQSELPLMTVNDDVLKRVASVGGISYLLTGAEGDLWIGGLGGVTHQIQGSSIRYPLPGGAGPRRWIQALALDTQNRLWASVLGETPWVLEHGVWLQSPALTSQPLKTPISAVALADGSVLFGYQNNHLVKVSAGKILEYGPDNGLHVGNIITLRPYGDHIWIGGSDGLAFWQNGAGVMIVAENQSLRGISGIVERHNGDLWLNTSNGALLIRREELKNALNEPSYKVKAQTFDYLDNVPGGPMLVRPLPSVAEAISGRLYFAGQGGVAYVDPDRINRTQRPPVVQLDQVTVGGNLLPISKETALPPDPQSVEFQVSVGSISLPERTTLAYRLNGLGADWQSTGTNRTLTFPRLQPGHYVLDLQATNADGVSNSRITSFAFYVPPTFVESLWFKLLIAALCLLLIGAAYILRVRMITERLRQNSALRKREREAIARDLHDSFFQGIQGLLIQLGVAERRLPSEDPLRGTLQSILDQSDDVMREGRELVFQLRSSELTASNLPSAVNVLKKELERLYPGNTLECTVSGEVRQLSSAASSELFLLLREALWNAFRHSRASNIGVHLTFSRNELRIIVADDGRGIPDDFITAGQRVGHWGLQNMRERTTSLGGTILISNQGGTTITFCFRASAVY